MTTPILIDCDPGHDDAIALLLAAASPEVELIGVTTVAGNQTIEKTTLNALKVLELDRPRRGSVEAEPPRLRCGRVHGFVGDLELADHGVGVADLHVRR